MKETVSGTAVVALRLPGARDRLGPTDNGRPAIRPRSRRAVLIIGGAAALNSPTDPGTPATNESNPEHLALAVVDELEPAVLSPTATRSRCEATPSASPLAGPLC